MIHILANGLRERFGSTSKQLVPVWGVPVLRRTCLMLKELGEECIVFTSDQWVRAVVQDVAMVLPGLDPPEGILQEEYEIVKNWSKDFINRLLYGDVVWERSALYAVCDCKKPMVFGNKKNHGGEGYAIVYPRTEVPVMLTCYKAAIDQVNQEGLKNSGWYMSRRWTGIDPLKVEYNDKMFADLSGWTMDFDFPEDYEYFKKEVEPKHDGT